MKIWVGLFLVFSGTASFSGWASNEADEATLLRFSQEWDRRPDDPRLRVLWNQFLESSQFLSDAEDAPARAILLEPKGEPGRKASAMPRTAMKPFSYDWGVLAEKEKTYADYEIYLDAQREKGKSRFAQLYGNKQIEQWTLDWIALQVKEAKSAGRDSVPVRCDRVRKGLRGLWLLSGGSVPIGTQPDLGSLLLYSLYANAGTGHPCDRLIASRWGLIPLHYPIVSQKYVWKESGDSWLKMRLVGGSRGGTGDVIPVYAKVPVAFLPKDKVVEFTGEVARFVGNPKSPDSSKLLKEWARRAKQRPSGTERVSQTAK